MAIKCDICNKEFNNLEALAMHNLVKHPSGADGSEVVRCEVCDKEFDSKDALMMHNSSKHLRVKSRVSGKTVFAIATLCLVVLVGSFFVFGNGSGGNSISGDATVNSVQKVTLGYKNNYFPGIITVKEGEPVELTLDSSVGGCFRSFNIPELGVSKYSQNPSDKIRFTPTKKGDFEFACGMRMGTGTIIVV